MYTLYYSPGACSMAVHVLLNETKAKYDMVDVKDAQNKAAFGKANPRLMVPTLEIDGKVLREGAAILITVCEREKSALLPASGFERAKALEWLSWANSTLHPKYGAVFATLFKLNIGKDDALKNPLTDAALTGIQKCWDEVEQELADKDYICGKDMTVGDILITVIANWSPNMPRPINFGPKTKAYLARVSARPSYKQALADEKVEYKVAA